jgi:enoyl-CoA hydratase
MAKKGEFPVEKIKQVLQITAEDLKNEAILKRKGSVFVLALNRKVNSITHAFLRTIHALLDEVQQSEGNCALLTISLNEKIFSTGLDLKYMVGLSEHDLFTLLLETQRLMGRLHAFPVPTVALINGYAIAGGNDKYIVYH